MINSHILKGCFLAVFLSLLVICNTSIAASLDVYDFSTVEQQKRYVDLLQELRCLVCQNQSLSASNAELAQDMRAIVAEMINNDIADEAIIQFMTDRYGNFVRYRPALSKLTLILWGLPFLLMLIGLVYLPVIISQHHSTKLSEEERQRAMQMLVKK